MTLRPAAGGQPRQFVATSSIAASYQRWHSSRLREAAQTVANSSQRTFLALHGRYSDGPGQRRDDPRRARPGSPSAARRGGAVGASRPSNATPSGRHGASAHRTLPIHGPPGQNCNIPGQYCLDPVPSGSETSSQELRRRGPRPHSIRLDDRRSPERGLACARTRKDDTVDPTSRRTRGGTRAALPRAARSGLKADAEWLHCERPCRSRRGNGRRCANEGEPGVGLLSYCA
jgi:hypothetical protein